MTDEDLMTKAIEEAQKSDELLKCGCVIAKNGEIISTAFNSQRSDGDATAHDGIKAVAMAGKRLGQKNLEGCSVFCTHEPCTMCLSAMVFAKVEAIYYGISLSDVSDNHTRIQIDTEELIAKGPRPIRLVKNFMENEVRKILGPTP